LEQQLGRRLQVEETKLVYEPRLLALGSVSFVDSRRGVDEKRAVGFLLRSDEIGAVIRWQEAESAGVDPSDLENRPDPEALFANVPPEFNSAAELKAIAKDFSEYLYREERFSLHHNPTLKLYGLPEESERDFQIRAQQLARELRDSEVEKMRRKYDRMLNRLETQLGRERRELAEDKADLRLRRREEMISAGETIVGLLGVFGRRRSATGASRAARKHRLTANAKADVAESEEEIERLKSEIEEMREEMRGEAEAIADKWGAAAEAMGTHAVKPRRVDVHVELVSLAWVPFREIGYRSTQGRLIHDRVPGWS
jgi:hypothetical protein